MAEDLRGRRALVTGAARRIGRAVALALAREGVDVVIHFPPDTLDDLSFDSVVTNLQVNAWAPFALCRELARRVGTAHVINLVDSRIDDFDWGHVGYMLSKNVLAVLTAAAALKWAPGLRVNGVAPGLILPPPGKPIEYIERLKTTVPLQERGDPQDVADAVVYLARSRFVTGEMIYVDGGRHLREYGSGQDPR